MEKRKLPQTNMKIRKIKINKERRKFLKLLAMAGGVFLLGRLSSSFPRQFGELEVGGSFKSFLLKEERGKLVFYNRQKEKVFTIHPDGTMEIG